MAKSAQLPSTWQVPEIFRERLGAKVGRQRAMAADGHLLLVLHCPPKPDEPERKGRFFWRQPDGTWSSDRLGAGVRGLEKHINEYVELLDACEQREEAAATAQQYFELIEAIAPLHRAARNLHNTLQDARKMCPDDRDIINLRDRAYDIDRNGELLYNGSKNALEFAIAKRAEEQAASGHEMAVAAHRLNLLAAFFFPLATLSAIFGVNLLHGYEEAPGPMPFLIMVGGGLLAGAVLAKFVTTRK